MVKRCHLQKYFISCHACSSIYFIVSLCHLQINTGVIHENPASTTGVIKILEHIAQYVPNTNDASTGTVVSGDGMSVEKMLHAIRGRANGHTRADRMQWAWPCPQEFHKDILLLQVMHVC